MDADRIYRHFCMTARALEVVGERWSLLIVRDLLYGPRRFTDLTRSLAEITPARLTGRLRQLQTSGIVIREPLAGREVQYRLTDAGLDLAPVIEALTLWGIQHELEQPQPAEPVHPVPALLGTKVVLESFAPPPRRPVAWLWRFPDDDYWALSYDGAEWTLARGRAVEAAVTVSGSPAAWATFLTSPPAKRRLPLQDVQLKGKRAEIQKFARAFRAKLAPS